MALPGFWEPLRQRGGEGQGESQAECYSRVLRYSNLSPNYKANPTEELERVLSKREPRIKVIIIQDGVIDISQLGGEI